MAFDAYSVASDTYSAVSSAGLGAHSFSHTQSHSKVIKKLCVSFIVVNEGHPPGFCAYLPVSSQVQKLAKTNAA